jgi:hypothetical protein
MYLYRHHTADDIIDLDDRTGHWSPVESNDDDPIIVGQMTMLRRASFSIRGSYTIEDEKRSCFYWNDDDELVFRTPDNKRFCLFKLEGGNQLTDLLPDISVSLEPATYGDGRQIPNYSTFRLVDGSGTTLFDTSYDSQRYVYFYSNNFTFAPDEDLSDWDFFVAVKRTVDELKLIAQAQVQASATASAVSKSFAQEKLITAETGQPAPCAGLWVPCNRLNIRCVFSKGESLPNIDEQATTWVLVAS